MAATVCMAGSAARAQSSAVAIYDAGAFPPSVPYPSSSRFYENDADPTGSVQTYLPGGQISTAANPFFQALGTNGRSCATCHQPPSGMGLGIANVQARYTATGGADPIFAPIDGATCPSQASGFGQPKSAFNLLLNRGLIRIPITVPANAQFTVTVVSDPYGCNTDPRYNQTTDPKTGATLQVVSLYRRPLMAANLPFVTTSIPVPPNKVARPPAIMWDSRETSLSQQAIDAVLGHEQGAAAPSPAQLDAIVQFESTLFTAQALDTKAGSLLSGGATGGAAAVAHTMPGQFPAADAVFDEYDAWASASTQTAIGAQRASIARGQALFGARTFNFIGVEGVNSQPFVSSCGRCHGQPGDGNDPHGSTGRLAIGVGGSSPQFNGPPPSKQLPIFQVVCQAPYTTQYHGSTVTTNDPGAALITGLCADIEKFKTPALRGLAARAPYFHDGSAATLLGVVNFYNRRFSIGLTPQEEQDMANFLASL